MKKRVLSIIALMCCILKTFCMPVGATNLEQDEPEIIATEEFVVYMTDQSRSVSETTAVYPVNVRTNILYLKSKGLGFQIVATTTVPILDGLNGFVEYNTSIDPDHGSVVPYSESNNTPGRTITWIDYTGNKYDSGVKITATFSGVVSADAKYLGQEVLINGPYTQTVTATIP